MALNSVLGKLLFGKKPKLPGLEEITLQDSQRKAIDSNIAALPDAQKLGQRVDKYNQEQLLKELRANIPQFDELVSGVSSNIASGLKGEIPTDVQNEIQNKAAARALGGGYGGSGMGRNLVARDFGLTSYEISQNAINSAQQWLQVGKQAFTAPKFDVTSMFVSPMQQAQFDVSERNQRWNYNWFKAQHDALPKPWQQAVDQVATWLEETATSYASFSLGNLAQGKTAQGFDKAPKTGPGGGMDGGGGSGGGYGSSGYYMPQNQPYQIQTRSEDRNPFTGNKAKMPSLQYTY